MKGNLITNLQSFIANSFLASLHKQKRQTLFYIFCIYLLGQFMYILLRRDHLPFPLWAMYSQKHDSNPSVVYYRIKINNKELNYYTELSDFEKERILSPVGYYADLKEANFIDPNCTNIDDVNLLLFGNTCLSHICNTETSTTNFKNYLTKSIEQIKGTKISSFKVIKEVYHYSPSHQLVLDSTETIIE